MTGEVEHAVAVGDDDPGEQVVAGPLAIPLRQRSASTVGLDREAGEELIDLDVMRELRAGGDTRGDVMPPAKL
jgi:hypothetical protein